MDLHVGLRNVVREVVDSTLSVAPGAPEVHVLVQCSLVRVQVRVLHLAQHGTVPLHPLEVVRLEPDPEEVIRCEEECVLLRAVVVVEHGVPVEVQVLEPSMQGLAHGVVEPLLSLERVRVAPTHAPGSDDDLGLLALRADVVQQELPLILVEGGVAAIDELPLPVLVAGLRAVSRMEDGLNVRPNEVPEAVHLPLPVAVHRRHVSASRGGQCSRVVQRQQPGRRC